MPTGEEKVWETLAGLSPDEVCRRSEAVFDPSADLYILESFGREFRISPREKRLFSDSPEGEVFLRRLGYFFRLSVIGYLALAKDIPLSGRLLKPENMKSGQLFFRGSHVLPLDKVAEKYGSDRDQFLERGRELGGRRLTYGDASLRLFPLPRVPVVEILWLADEEFPSRADLLFDSASEIQLPIDVIWSIAMLSVLVFS
ncbi:MAG: DUF3786 domain-containing protein [Nitrospirae bacterium]|nr:DUF3786 domain-containing protein [Nitrospirota bacterium]